MLPAGDPRETVSLISCDTIRVAESNLLALIVCCRSKWRGGPSQNRHEHRECRGFAPHV